MNNKIKKYLNNKIGEIYLKEVEDIFNDIKENDLEYSGRWFYIEDINYEFVKEEWNGEKRCSVLAERPFTRSCIVRLFQLHVEEHFSASNGRACNNFRLPRPQVVEVIQAKLEANPFILPVPYLFHALSEIRGAEPLPGEAFAGIAALPGKRLRGKGAGHAE